MNNQQNVQSQLTLLGKIVLRGVLVARTGLHIGGAKGGVDIGGLDKPVIRDMVTGQPYVPGSSLKGKMRSLAERAGFNGDSYPPNQPIGNGIKIHECSHPTCALCIVYGRTPEAGRPQGADKSNTTPTRLIVRDAHLTKRSAESLYNQDLDLLYTEVKWEVGIDRITSAANPRQMERVPAGARFGFNISFSVLETGDVDRFAIVMEAMRLLEDDYLGGLGSRGSGQVAFAGVQMIWRPVSFYATGKGEIDLVQTLGLGKPKEVEQADTSLATEPVGETISNQPKQQVRFARTRLNSLLDQLPAITQQLNLERSEQPQ